MSDSYPDEPVILYKTSEDKEIRISPETALFAIIMKQELIKSAERDEREALMCKSAQLGKDTIRKGLLTVLGGIKNIGDKASNMIPAANIDQAEDIVMKTLEDPRNNDILFELAQNPDAGITDDMIKKVVQRTPHSGMVDLATVARSLYDPKFKADLMSRVKTGNRMQNLIVNRATSDDYADTWGKLKQERINSALGKYFTPGGFMHGILSWILNNTGLGNYFAKNHINDMFANMRKANGQAQQNPVAQNAQATPPPQPATSTPPPQPTATTSKSSPATQPATIQDGNIPTTPNQELNRMISQHKVNPDVPNPQPYVAPRPPDKGYKNVMKSVRNSQIKPTYDVDVGIDNL
jgi:hypothetical protein